MSLRRLLSGIFCWCAVFSCVAMGCTHQPAAGDGDSRAIGRVSVSITLEEGSKLDVLVYKISGNGIDPIVRRLDITKVFQSTQSFEGLPSGTGYTVSVDAASAAGDVACHAQTGFEVAANQTAQVKLTPFCRLADAGVGSVTLTGTFDGCPYITAGWMTSRSAAIGQSVSVGVTADDPDPADDTKANPLTYDWTTSPDGRGTFSGTEGQANRRFVCAVAGKVMLIAKVSDGTCERSTALSFECLKYPGPQTGGASSCVSITGYSVGARYEGLPVGEKLPVFATASSAASKAISYQWTATPATGGTFDDATMASTSFNCAVAGSVTLALSASDGVCTYVRDPIAHVTCLPGPRPPRDGGIRDGGKDGSAGGVADGSTGGTAAGGSNGGAGGSGGTGDTMIVKCPVEPITGTTPDSCTSCTVGNCTLGAAGTDGCCGVANPADQDLCIKVVKCFANPPVSSLGPDCTSMGDGTNCFCGTSGGACFSTKGAASGPCTGVVFDAAKTKDPPTIQGQFTSPASPLGRAVNLTACRGSFCNAECAIK